jgi:hypothetical protein
MVSSLTRFTEPSKLPPPPEWMLKEVELFEKMEEMVNKDYEKRARHIRKNTAGYTKFSQLKPGKIYNHIVAHKYPDFQSDDWYFLPRIECVKIIKNTKCMIRYEVFGNEVCGQKYRYERYQKKSQDDKEEYVAGLCVSNIYDPKKDIESAAKIIQRGFRFHRWNIKGKFIWRVEERRMNDDGFFWDEEGNMIK